jgi:hypothetical protein
MIRQVTIIMDAVREELEEDGTVFDSGVGQRWLLDFAQLMIWTATGDYSVLPEELLSVARKIEGIPEPEPAEPLFTVEVTNGAL